jgi:hypothetical protein
MKKQVMLNNADMQSNYSRNPYFKNPGIPSSNNNNRQAYLSSINVM